jgi:hypothetical protein
VVMLTPSQHDDVSDVVAVVAHRLARKYRPWAEADDVRQDLWVWLLSKGKRLNGVVDAATGEDYQRELKFLERNLYRAGDIKCRADKARRSGYKQTDEFFYSQTLIIALIEAHCNGDHMVSESMSDKVRRTRTLSEGLEIETMLADFRSALAKLEPDQRSLLIRLYGENVPSKVIAEERDVTRQAIEQRAARLVDKMIDELGGESPY